jgi:hypothetical protein
MRWKVESAIKPGIDILGNRSPWQMEILVMVPIIFETNDF